MSGYKLPMDYIDVAARIVEFRTKHPEGSLQQIALDFREVAGGWWVVYTAAAYRTPDDARPGHGTAWEPVPGKTNFTRDSEVQNAETAAWGRAIVAALAADTKKGIASAEEVRNRQVSDDEPDLSPLDFEKRISDAATAQDLNVLAGEIAASTIGGKARDVLRQKFSARAAELNGASV